MTREEARQWLKIELKLWEDECKSKHPIKEALSVAIEALEQEPRCKNCKWWKDSDGKYRRDIGTESQCPINTHAVYCGEGYCYMFSPKAESEGYK